jgi:hypothetical protein
MPIPNSKTTEAHFNLRENSPAKEEINKSRQGVAKMSVEN